ncbi:hypothetical protein HJX35_28740 (plasmid) [Klebsiella pneumoniae]|nr:hypothetical protein HJX14_26435 [Klebsiella pneumoniae]QJK52516.1 hypothetical protein HJX26_26625 [Klebsiella pneumoniae]QJK83956.1 hypothetical protein HJX06_26720 [Klebsiella pneumoniae]QJP02640.1 hypothetical protein HJX35_28740 [Klebsiella pneumoniae]
MPAFEWVHVQLHQQKGMISLSPPTICNSADQKSHRYGLGSDLHGTKKKSRLEILLLLAALVNWFHYLLGSAAEKAGLHLRYQANTVKNRRVLALNFLGILLCKEPKQRIRRQYYQQGLKQILQWVVQWDWAVIKQADS